MNDTVPWPEWRVGGPAFVMSEHRHFPLPLLWFSRIGSLC
ncbi:hypothetical protein HMPREF0591_4238 [Mycobacterium parascrofulaceum ATCC BAA-614]|uniref:Uncharacterized protein n=1 Tax=Mycobacterium parascrofulaceum ATCC BAA-614 TaxID=525368 RepID=D5PDJ4_9MYCO|nr:hypothetical protein HMPREF0591_4238 [Mycobacterium parascrofulaceum ATCC BAA-614]